MITAYVAAWDGDTFLDKEVVLDELPVPGQRLEGIAKIPLIVEEIHLPRPTTPEGETRPGIYVKGFHWTKEELGEDWA